MNFGLDAKAEAPPELRALIWDVDGTLAETERDGHRVAFNEVFAEFGLGWHWDVDEYGRLLAVTGGRERIRAYARERGAECAPELVEHLHRRKNALYARIVQRGFIELRPGVQRLLREARDLGLRQAIATTTSRANVEVLLSACLGPEADTLFVTKVCGEDVRAKKPDPEVYRRVLSELQLDAASCVAVEDSEAGLYAASAAGIACIVTRGIYTDRAALARCPHRPIAVVESLDGGDGQSALLVEHLQALHHAAPLRARS